MSKEPSQTLIKWLNITIGFRPQLLPQKMAQSGDKSLAIDIAVAVVAPFLVVALNSVVNPPLVITYSHISNPLLVLRNLPALS
jgi:hypothetical protein